MSAPKLLNIYGLLQKLEPSYNGGGAVTAAADGQWLLDPGEAEVSYLHDGARIAQAPGSGNSFKRLAPSGRDFKLRYRAEARGSGVAYSASVFPPDVHVGMRMAGHSVTTDVTGGAEKQTYAPLSLNDATWPSAVGEAYTRGQKYPFQAAYSDMSWEIDGPGTMVFEFPVSAIQTALPTDVVCPAITYQALTVTPPKAESMVWTFGSFTAGIIRSAKFSKNQTISGPRLNQNNLGHSGFSMGGRNPTLEVVLEAVALTTADPWSAAGTLNPYGLRDTAKAIAISMVLGPSGVYNRVKFNAAQAQVVDVKESADGPTALWTISFELKPSSPILSDDYSIAWTNT
jgi:hypothetical protein